MGWYELISKKNKREFIEKLQNIYSLCQKHPDDNYFFQNDLKTKTGKLISMEWNAQISGDNVICIGTDITVRIKAQRDLKKANIETHLMHGFYKTLLSGKNFKEQIDEVLHKLQDKFPLIFRASIVTFDEATNSAYFHRKGNIDGDGIHLVGTTALSDFRAYKVLQEKSKVLIPDLRKEPSLSVSDKDNLADGVISYLGSPLTYNGKVIGVLMAGSKHVYRL